MKIRASYRNRQGGAVAVMVGISIVLLVGFLAMVIDLGHLYLAKSELQNGADAAALAGAKELDGSLDGVKSAKAKAYDLAEKNTYDFSSKKVGELSLLNLNLSVGNCPKESCMVPIDDVISGGQPFADKTFLKVDTQDTPNRDLVAWFAPIWNIFHVSTYGMAVAGRYVMEVTPIGVCAVDVATDPKRGCDGSTGVNGASTVRECNFLRGVAYNLPDLNPLNNGDPIWINPIDKAPGPCEQNSTSVPNMAPYVCTGTSTTIATLPGIVWVDTGTKAALDAPLNSRFGDPTSYTGGHACDPVTAPADTNVKEFTCTQVNGVSPNGDNCIRPSSLPLNSPRDWMAPPDNTTPTRQSIKFSGSPRRPVNYPGRPTSFSDYGVLWSFSKEIKDFTTVPYTEYGTADWPTLYGGDAQNYPAFSPYLQYVVPPTGQGAAHRMAERRVLNIAIIDCAAVPPIAGQVCKQTLPVLAVGKFFMPVKADFNGSPKKLYGEFGEIVAPPMPPAEIRLYR